MTHAQRDTGSRSSSRQLSMTPSPAPNNPVVMTEQTHTWDVSDCQATHRVQRGTRPCCTSHPESASVTHAQRDTGSRSSSRQLSMTPSPARIHPVVMTGQTHTWDVSDCQATHRVQRGTRPCCTSHPESVSVTHAQRDTGSRSSSRQLSMTPSPAPNNHVATSGETHTCGACASKAAHRVQRETHACCTHYPGSVSVTHAQRDTGSRSSSRQLSMTPSAARIHPVVMTGQTHTWDASDCQATHRVQRGTHACCTQHPESVNVTHAQRDTGS